MGILAWQAKGSEYIKGESQFMTNPGNKRDVESQPQTTKNQTNRINYISDGSFMIEEVCQPVEIVKF